ncbi:MAG: GPW/gp25 family protein [Caldilineaceae bacterium]|nr:GPW/gp25 family protein [Caldilineaceae bacterium]MCB0125238.1 GPW/gp25 family protein [Caldilineaceae bacterium]
MQLTTEEDEIAQSILIILSTMPGERVLRPTFGCNLYELQFAPMNMETLALARRYVEEAITMWEPRITILNILVEAGTGDHDGALLIAMHYEIKSTRDKRSLVYPFYLIPEE